MNQGKVLLVALSLALLTTAGCTRYHHERPGVAGEPTLQEVVPEVKHLVEQNVKDPEKATQVQAMVQDIAKEVRKSNQEVRGFHEQLASLNADYNAKPDQFLKILDGLNNTRMESAMKILTMRFKIKELLSAEEWKNLNDAMIKARQEHEKKPPEGAMPHSVSPSSGY